MSAQSIKREPRTQRSRREDAEKALLDAAEQLITEQGLESTSLAQIGDLAGYSRGLVSHHFGSKSALFARLSERMQREFAGSIKVERHMNGLTTLLHVVDQYFRMKHARGTRGGTFFLIWANAINSGDSAGFGATESRARDEIMSIVETGVRDGSIRSTIEPRSIALTVIAIMRGIALQALVDPQHVDLLTQRESVTEFLRDALT
ncbi:MAG: TetR/AcrR family transcriptional regulator [Pseudomonadota bacterium]